MDDPPEVWAGEGIVAVEATDLVGHGRQQRLPHRRHDQQMVGGYAGLPCVETLAPHQPSRCDRHIGVVEDDRRAFAPQLQGHRREMAGCRSHHQPTDAAAAGEEDVVESLLQQPGAHGAVAADHPHGGGGEVAGYRLGEQGRGGRRQLRRFEHSGVAGGQGTDQRLEAELEWVVPGADDEHAAERFGLHGGPCRP